ncbi:hypothetical protein DM02DRAFT_297149 [Periconia macrospinosa]|uniref:Ankyrin n=1 Tax=Periconia macrospinosa TaxID=97972 RepID=A0A2V1DWG9_9PLEO|nr:hypothetical protein DM02DRAFT_297149 [Periconia macrospinosa]
MSLSSFSSTPSSPSWVAPPSAWPPPPPCNPPPNLHRAPSLTSLSPTAAALTKASYDLEHLCLSPSPPTSPPLASSASSPDDNRQIQTLLSEWAHFSDPRTGKIQRNALAWYTASSALEFAVRAKRSEVVRVLLDAGLAVNKRAVVAAAVIMVDGEKQGIGRDVDVGKTMLGCMFEHGVEEESVFKAAQYLIHSPTLMSHLLSLYATLHPSTHPFVPPPSLLTLSAQKSPLHLFKLLVSHIPTTTTPTLYFPKDILPQTIVEHGMSRNRMEVIEYLVGECEVDVREALWDAPNGLAEYLKMSLGLEERKGAGLTALQAARVYRLSDVERVLLRKGGGKL